MSDLETYEPAEVETTEQSMALSGPLALWASEAREAHSISLVLASTTFVPKHFQEKPYEVTAAILAGHELGLDPMASLRSIAVINGTPALTANAMRGLVQSRGHEVWVESESPTRAVVKAKRAGEDRIHSSEWTIDRAKALNLSERDQWRKQPQAMLVARATSEVCRRAAADVLIGMPYSVEELADVDGDAEELKPKRRRRKPLAAKESAPAIDPEPELEPESVVAEAATVDPEPELTDE